MAEDPDPPQKKFGFKARTFDVVNHTPATSPAGSPANPSASTSQPIDVRDLYHQASAPGPVLAREKIRAETDVHGVLRANVARENAAGLNELKPKPKRRSRRTRDYFLVLLPLLAFFGFMAFGPHRNPATFVYGIAGIIVSSVVLTWVMFFVMDDY